jgi:hypothetical protein
MTKSPVETRRPWIQAIAMLVVVFVIGALTGLALDRARGSRHPEPPPRQELPAEMRRALDLTPDQERRIERILKDNSGRAKDLMDRIMPQLQALKDTIRAEVRAELTPEQQEIFDRFDHPLDAPPPGPPPHLPEFLNPPPPESPPEAGNR